MWIKKKNLVRRISILFLVLFLLAGCKKSTVFESLTQEEANEVIVALYSAGIEAYKEKDMIQNEVVWNVAVKDKDLQEARRIASEQKIPTKTEPGLCGVYKESQIVPTPDEQKAHFLCGIKGDIINMLRSIPEVVDANVVINAPTPEEFSRDETKGTTASVAVKIKSGDTAASQITESKLQQHIANSVENLNPRDVSVIISYVGRPVSQPGRLLLPATTPKETDVKAATDMVRIAGISVSKKSAGRLKIYLFVFFILMIIMAAFLVINVVRTSRIQQEYKALSEGEDRNLLEGEVAESSPKLGPGEGGEE